MDKITITPVVKANIISFLLYALLYLCAGTYYETDDEGLYKIIFHALYDPHQHYYPIHHTFTRHLYAFLYGFSSDFPWYDVLNYTMFLLLVFNVNNILLAGQKKVSHASVFVIAAFNFCLLWLHFVSFTYLRTTILLAGTSAYLFSLEFQHQRISLKSATYYAFLLFWALNTRLEGAELGIILVLPLVILAYKNIPLKRKALACFCMILMALPIHLANFIRDSDPANQSYVKRETYIYTMFEGVYVNFEIPLKTAKDSMQLEAIKNGFVLDNEGVPFSFLDKVLDKQPISISNLFDYQKNLPKIPPLYIGLVRSTLVIVGLILLCAFIIGNKNRVAKKHLALAGVLAAYYTLVFTSVCWLLKPEPRFYEPASALILILIGGFFWRTARINYKLKCYSLLFASVLGFCYNYYTHQTLISSLKLDSKQRTYFINHVKNSMAGNTTVINYYFLHWVLANPFEEFAAFSKHQVITPDFFYMNVSGQFASAGCNAQSYKEFINCWLKNEKTVLISDSLYVDFLERYSATIYNIPLHFKNVDTFFSATPNKMCSPEEINLHFNHYQLE